MKGDEQLVDSVRGHLRAIRNNGISLVTWDMLTTA